MAYTKEQRDAKKKLEEVEGIKETTSKPIEDIVKEIIPEPAKKVEAPTPVNIKKPLINNLPLHTMAWVRSNCYGELIYVSKKTGFTTSWENYGIPQPLTLEELMTMRNTQINFFKRNLIIIEGFQDPEYNETYSVEEILAYLQVTQYYTKLLCPNNLDDVFKMTPEKIEECVPRMSSGVKNSILVKANELIEKGEIDSIKMVRSLEKALGCELSEVK